MNLLWTSKAQSDVGRIYSFLASMNEAAAAKAVSQLYAAPEKLIANPRIGARLPRVGQREVRRILVGNYEMRYELRQSTILILRIRHTREQIGPS